MPTPPARLWLEKYVSSLAAILAVVATYFFVGDFNVRLANQWIDDSPVIFARYIADPAHWSGDVFAYSLPAYAYGTLQNLVPGLLLRYFHVQPEMPTLVLTYLQNIVFVLGLLTFARAVSATIELACLVTVFCFVTLPQTWNLSAFTTSIAGPYPAQFVLGFLLLSAAAWLRGRVGATIGWLVLGGLVHPALAVMMGGILLIANLLVGERRMIPPLIGALVAFLLPSLIAASRISDKVGGHDMMAALRTSGDHFPGLNARALPRIRDYALPTFVGFSLLGWLAIHRLPPHGRRYGALLKASAIALGLGVMTYIAGVTIGIPALLVPSPLRVSSILMLLVAPIAVEYLLERARSGEIVPSWIAGVIFMLIVTHGSGFYWAATLALFLAPKHPRLALGIFAGWIIGLIATGPLGLRDARAVLSPGVMFGTTQFIFALVAAAGLAWVTTAPAKTLPSRWWRVSAPTALFFMVAFFFVGVRAGEEGSVTREPHLRSNYDAQTWAREHTADDALFVVAVKDMPFRIVSNRRSLYGEPGPYVVYSRARAAAELGQREIAFYEGKGKKSLENLDDSELVEFSRQFGGAYLVVPRERSLELPKLYENRELAIYAVR